MFDENGNFKEIETIKEGNNRFTNVGNILQDYIDEDNEENKKGNNNIADTKAENKNNSNKKKLINLKLFY